MALSHLYQISNKVTGEFYTGVHHGMEQNGYWGSGIRIKRSIKKYGKDNFEYRIWFIGETNVAYELEKIIVNEEEINNNPLCLNLKVGGFGGTKLSQSAKQQFLGENNHFFGKTHSEETRKKISDAKKGCTLDPEVYVKRTEKHLDKYKESIANARAIKQNTQMLKTYVLKNPDGQVMEIKGYNELKKYGNPDSLSAVSKGVKTTYKGWSKA
jgi:hypothetical protein